MPRSTDVRYLLLRYIPRQPDRITTTELVRLLSCQGVVRTPRAVQKLCADLALQEPDIVCDDRSKPFQWSWKKGAKQQGYPAMDPHAALTSKIAFEHARHLLPTATFDHLRHQQRQAEEVLARSGALRGWRRKLRVLPRGLDALPPKIDRGVLRVVYEALFAERRLDIVYRRRQGIDDERFEVSPLGLVSRGPILTLVCTIAHKDGPRQLHLHRMKEARALSARALPPAGFDLDAHVRAGNLAFRKSEEPLRLRLRLQPEVIPTLEELRLSEDQTIVREADGTARLEATLVDTLDLRGWLKSYGPTVEVLGPQSLRRAIAAELRAAAALYGGD